MTAEERIDNAMNGWIQDAVLCGKGQAKMDDLRANLVAAVRSAEFDERDACAAAIEALQGDWHDELHDWILVRKSKAVSAVRARSTP